MAIVERNPYGAVQIADGGTPRVITVLAYENISGGYWVNGSATGNCVGSGADSYAASDIKGGTNTNMIGSMTIGLALQDIASGTYGPAAMRGLYLMPGMSGTQVGSGFAGQSFLAGSAGTIVPLGSGVITGAAQGIGLGWEPTAHGRIITAGGVGSFSIVSLNI